MVVDIVSLIAILLFPVGLVLGVCEEPRIKTMMKPEKYWKKNLKKILTIK